MDSSLDFALGRIENLRLTDFILPYRELPQEALESAEAIVNLFENADAAEREHILGRMHPNFTFVFLRYSRRMAEEAVRHQRAEFLQGSLIALVIASAGEDGHGMLPYFSFINASARRLDLAPKVIFAEGTQYSNRRFNELTTTFVARDESRQSPECFGFQAVGAQESFSYDYQPKDQPKKIGFWKKLATAVLSRKGVSN